MINCRVPSWILRILLLWKMPLSRLRFFMFKSVHMFPMSSHLRLYFNPGYNRWDIICRWVRGDKIFNSVLLKGILRLNIYFTNLQSISLMAYKNCSHYEIYMYIFCCFYFTMYLSYRSIFISKIWTFSHFTEFQSSIFDSLETLCKSIYFTLWLQHV